MAYTVNINIKMDEDIKKRMERVCAELSLSDVRKEGWQRVPYTF